MNRLLDNLTNRLFDNIKLESEPGDLRSIARGLISVVFALLVAFLLECSVFQFHHWVSLTYPEIETPEYVCGPGLIDNGDGTYLATTDDRDQVYIEFADLNEYVKNIYINACFTDEEEGRARLMGIYIAKTDEADGRYRKFDSKHGIITDIEESRYITPGLSGECKDLKIFIDIWTDMSVIIKEVKLNKVVPFSIKKVRLMVLWIFCLLFMAFRPGSVLYKRTLNLRSDWQKLAVLALLVLHIAILEMIVFAAKPFKSIDRLNYYEREYETLADSLINGHADIYRYTPPDWLVEMDDPYDYQMRGARESEFGGSYKWDFAFYNGKYYVYFGVVPAIVYFMPYQLLTGARLDTTVSIILNVFIYCLGMFALVRYAARRYMTWISVGLYMLLSSMMTAGGCIALAVRRSSMYTVAISTGLAFAVCSIALWLGSVGRDGRINRPMLVAGSVLGALVAGCRPQMALVTLLAFVIFKKEIKDRKFFSIRGLGNTACVIVPYLIIGSLLMYYNYIRFDSPFDFGAAYNLTQFNMPHHAPHFTAILQGLFETLLQPMNILPEYPFIRTINFTPEHMGFSLREDIIGGLFAMSPVAFYGFYVFGQRKQQAKPYTMFAICLYVTAFIICVFDVGWVGVITRYFSDHAWLFMLPAALVIMDHSSRSERPSTPAILLSSACVFVNYFYVLTDFGFWSIQGNNSPLYFQIKYLFFKIF